MSDKIQGYVEIDCCAICYHMDFELYSDTEGICGLFGEMVDNHGWCPKFKRG